MKRYQMLIGGEWVDAEAGARHSRRNPYLGAALGVVPRAKSADVDRAVEAARRRFARLRGPQDQRDRAGALLRKLADLIAVEDRSAGEIETRDNGS